ncbi:MAG: ABC transporter ATP-binding protein [Rhodocyclaceae bacterium]|nr:MAG: ABC transporter ATP-binding protein [Rhodocyclaceae bacterium]
MIAIKIENLRKTYPRAWASKPVEALRSISLEIKAGEVFGFIGANGAGKSTTIKILTGAMAPSSGTASIFGVPIDRPEARQGIAYVPENPSLPDYLTPLEILRGAIGLQRLQVSDVNAHCRFWLDKFQIGHVANRTLRTFSKGMAQRTALAHALCVRPRLLILDEPLSGLDPLGRREVVDILAEYKAQGGTVFLTSHVLHDVERLADRFGLIHQGQMRVIMATADLMAREQSFLVRSLGNASVSGMDLTAAGYWQGEIKRNDLWDLIRGLEAAGHRLVEVRPSLNLEQVFMNNLQQTDN